MPRSVLKPFWQTQVHKRSDSFKPCISVLLMGLSFSPSFPSRPWGHGTLYGLHAIGRSPTTTACRSAQGCRAASPSPTSGFLSTMSPVFPSVNCLSSSQRSSPPPARCYLAHNKDKAYSGPHATAQHTGLQLETMSQALFRGLF